MPGPQHRTFAGADQSAFDPGSGQELCKALNLLSAIGEDRLRGRRHRLQGWAWAQTALSAAGGITIRRCGSSPSDSVRTPATSETASCTALRSNGVIDCSFADSPDSRTCSAV